MSISGVPKSDERRLAKVYERNCWRLARILCAETGGWVFEEDGVSVHARPVTYFFNGLYYAPWRAKEASEKLRLAIRLYQPTGQGMMVTTGPSSPADVLREELLAFGFRCNCYIPFMYLDLGEIQFPQKMPKGIEIRQWTDYSLFKKYPHPWHGKATTRPRRAMFSFLQKEANAKKRRCWQFIAFDGKVPVGSAMVFRTGKTCGIYDVATVETHRRRGIGHAVMATACAFARQQGMEAAGLGSSGVGVGLYAKTGFRLCGKYGVYYLGKDKVAALKV